MEPLETSESGNALWLTLRRPPLNVLSIHIFEALEAALRPLEARRDLKAVVVRSGLDGTFSAGSDVRDHTRERAPAMLRAFHAVIRRLHTLPQATLALVDGRCLGGGCELALVCDIVLATPRATFGQPEIDLAWFPPVAAAWLPRLASRAAVAMVLGGAPLGAHEAAAAGLITRVVDDLDGAAGEWTARLAGKSAAALALARRAVRAGGEGPFLDALTRLEQSYIEELLRTEDAAEGVAAFLEKRAPRWRDR
jgi:cyclohexa-1,5-dienecarbonyl-CoA hydratase